MLYHLSEEHEMLRQFVREFAESQLAPNAAEVDDKGVFAQQQYDALVEAGFAAPGIPEQYGGDGADAIASAIIMEEVARVCASSSTVISSNELGTVPLLKYGSEEQRKRYLSEVASGKALFGYALSEADAGSDPAALKCRADEDGDSFILNGVKAWVTEAGEAKYLVVFAVTDPDDPRHRISALMVHADDPGISYGAPEHKMGIRGSVTREVVFKNTCIPKERVIGRRGHGLSVALGTLDNSRVSIAAQAVGIAQGALDIATDYVQKRKQFGQPLSNFEGIQFMLADMAMRLEAARALTYSAADRSGRQTDDVSYFGAAAKCFASDTAMAVCTDAVQLLGGIGYSKDSAVERMFRDAKVTQIYEGTNQIQRIVIARQLFNRSR
ncbi:MULTISPECIES: acyl-CoA dehydrogenase family protein [Cutibacterium]|uniref:acyl-CoA dehydrogenase family protein n=1 Tax=Cutibacterium TaxID=1912216 RepID=UPI0001EF347B|nr:MULTISPECIES: acyl-CoA dehydrogenase family protein [Cutibacterium]OFO87505.1 acyl-CoA dehydrogenase [Propionibacterium sp. HMSC062D05]EFS44475.1 acyl-CoA dehydrogenase, C-terminal domain protein [Cutibacterium acnes HL110PA2]EFS76903.1 acyl-CoA dehydrogenase, C-terminal domain protein [Cutibacterium acnes HL086PA1]EFT08153.1 acyl-CoA dehydrogenase, C-terminal domain protein [Cutibacterium acnes HL082PA1]EGE76102.1 acyl-CoA dehydrogenase, C-terminal domain protein [Cutibacterium acnes HL097